MKPLTDKQRAVLQHARHKPAPHNPNEHSTHQIHHALQRAGHLTLTDDGWAITPTGIKALNQPIPHKPRLLMSGSPLVRDDRDRERLTDLEASGYTTDPHRSDRNEPEAVDPATLHPRWTTDATDRHTQAQDPTRHANRIIRALRRAA